MQSTMAATAQDAHSLAADREHDPCATTTPATTTPAAPPQTATDLATLYAEALSATKEAVTRAEATHAQELEDMGHRLRAEQESLYQAILANMEAAVKEAACRGQRHATVLQFEGSARFGEFCYLYMLKGPYKPDLRAEMKAMGAAPLMHRLRAALHPVGFGVHHAWQRATNDNTVVVTW